MRRTAAVVFALCVLPNTSNAAPEENFRLYANVCLNEESGDTHGVRIGIVKLTEASYAFLQWAESYPDEKLEMSVASPEDLKLGKLVFSVLIRGKPATFRGTITPKALTGQFNPVRPGDPKVFHLRRVTPQGYIPKCV